MSIKILAEGKKVKDGLVLQKFFVFSSLTFIETPFFAIIGEFRGFVYHKIQQNP